MSKRKKVNRGEKHMKAVMQCLLRIVKNWRGNLVGEVSAAEVSMEIRGGCSIVRFTAYDKARNHKALPFYSYEPEEVAEDVLINLNNVLARERGCCLGDIQSLRDQRAWALTFWRDRG